VDTLPGRVEARESPQSVLGGLTSRIEGSVSFLPPVQ
jgi:hypothetical protein